MPPTLDIVHTSSKSQPMAVKVAGLASASLETITMSSSTTSAGSTNGSALCESTAMLVKIAPSQGCVLIDATTPASVLTRAAVQQRAMGWTWRGRWTNPEAPPSTVLTG